MTIIFGVDPGFERCGVAIIDTAGGVGKEKLLFSSSIVTKKKDGFSKRLLELGKSVENVVEKYSPGVLSIEKLYFSKNQKTAMSVAEARGVIILEAARAGLEVVEFSPSEIKLAIAGHGKADKRELEKMVRQLIKFPKKGVLDDEIDAVAVALTCSAYGNKRL